MSEPSLDKRNKVIQGTKLGEWRLESEGDEAGASESGCFGDHGDE